MSDQVPLKTSTKEYARETLTIHPLASFEPLSAHAEQDDEIIRIHATPLPTEAELTLGVQVDTYVYRALERLDPDLWMFDDFVQNHADQWFNYVPDDSSIEVDAVV